MLNAQDLTSFLKLLVQLSKEGKRIEAIKEVRHFTGLTLKEAKDIIDVLIPYNDPTSSKPDDNNYIVVGVNKYHEFSFLQPETSKVNAFEEAKYYAENAGYTGVMVTKVVAKSRSKEVFDATP
jgi:hypothetical protein